MTNEVTPSENPVHNCGTSYWVVDNYRWSCSECGQYQYTDPPYNWGNPERLAYASDLKDIASSYLAEPYKDSQGNYPPIEDPVFEPHIKLDEALWNKIVDKYYPHRPVDVSCYDEWCD